MDETSVIEFIKTVGFPISVTCWLLYKDYKFNTKVVQTLANVNAGMTSLQKKFDKE